MKNHTVWIYVLCYNESHFVKNFLVGYKDADKIIVLNNMSTDNSVDLLKEDPRVEIRDWDSGGRIRDDLYLEMKNNVWKEARGEADWVIVVDFDEIFTRAVTTEDGCLFDLDLTEPHEAGFNIIKPYGYLLVSPEAPLYQDGHPHEYANKGTYHVPSEKFACFRPDHISEMRYSAGAHWSSPLDMDGKPDGVRIYFQPEYKLLHYKFWNVEYYLERMKDYQERMSAQNKEQGWGYHYMYTIEAHERQFLDCFNICEPLFDIRSPYDEYEEI